MNQSFHQVRIRGWLWVAGSFIAVMVLFRCLPGLAERLYGNGVYPIVRGVLDRIPMPFNGLQVTLVLVFAYLFYLIGKISFKKSSYRHKAVYAFRSLIRFFCVLIVWFYLIWGFNYARPDLLERMKVGEATPDSVWLFNQIEEVIGEVNRLRAINALSDFDHLNEAEIISTDFDIGAINQLLESVLTEYKYNLKIAPKFCFIRPPGALLHWSTAGIYWPFTGQSNVDEGVHVIRKPVTIAHELAHAHGLTSEGDCNFVAYLACRDSQNPQFQYSAHLSYLSYLMRDALTILGRPGLDRFYNQMSAEVKSDRQAIFDHHNSYKDYFPELRNTVYDSYLRSQGVKGGMSSYNYFVNLKYQFDR